MVSVSPAERPAIVWRSLVLRMALLAVPAWFTIAVLIFRVPVSIKLIVAFVLAMSLVSPVAGLLTVAALAPLGTLLSQYAGDGNFRMSEAMVLAFVTGWLLHALKDRPGPGVPSTIGWLLAAAIAASVGGVAWQFRRYPGELAETGKLLFFAYYRLIDRIGVLDGARLIEGLALAAATVTLFRQRPQVAVTLPMALAASATVAAASALLLWWGIAPPAILARHARIGYRVSAHVADVNAAGSYYAMTLCLVVGMAARAAGIRRALWLVAALATALGLWLSVSRSAAAAAAIVIALAVAWKTTASWRPSTRAIALGSVLAAALVLGGARVHLLEQDPTYPGARFRTQFNATSLRMIAARPLFGVGVGQYYRTSPLFLSPQLAWAYGAENAHNYFLQVGAELGVLGLALFCAWAGVVLWRAMNAIASEPHDVRLLGAAGGVLVLLLTCLTGHPLLVDEVAFPFWIQFGLVAGLSGSVLLNADLTAARPRAPSRRPQALPLAVAASVVCVVLLAPVSAAMGTVEPAASQSVDGFYGLETDDEGTRFRWTEDYASLFVPADVTHVYIPVRLPTDRRAIAPIGVEVATAGVKQSRTLVDRSWSFLAVRVPDVLPPARFKRIDLKMDRTWQPALYIAGSADMRRVGIQVGENIQLVR
jgi:O-antigen ligase